MDRSPVVGVVVVVGLIVVVVLVLVALAIDCGYEHDRACADGL